MRESMTKERDQKWHTLFLCCTPQPTTPLPGHLTDQTPRVYPGEIALNGSAADTGQRFGHRTDAGLQIKRLGWQVYKGRQC
jgi:hypothetical protein